MQIIQKFFAKFQRLNLERKKKTELPVIFVGS